MSILIKGIEMPFCCLVCPCSGTDHTDKDNEVWVCEANNLHQITTEDKIRHRPEWCPLIPIPPHGRLIDADELTISTAVPLDGKPYQYVHIDNIKGAPIIIPATPQKEK